MFLCESSHIGTPVLVNSKHYLDTGCCLEDMQRALDNRDEQWAEQLNDDDDDVTKNLLFDLRNWVVNARFFYILD